MEQITGNWGIVVTAIGGLFVFVKWLDVRSKDAQNFRLDAIERLTKYLSLQLDNNTKEDILLTEEYFSAIYGKSLTIQEIKLLLSAASPKRSFDMYAKNKQFLTIEGSKVKYRSQPVKPISVFGKNLSISIHNIKNILGATALLFIAVIPGAFFPNYWKEFIATENITLKFLSLINVVGTLSVAVACFAVAFFLLTRIVNLPSKKSLQQEFGDLF